MGRGWEHINEKYHPIWYAVPTTADVLQSQPQALFDSGKDDGSKGDMEIIAMTEVPNPNDTINLSN